MHNPNAIMPTLVRHFFRRFFDNDSIDPDGDTQTTVVRALSIVAMPGFVLAFLIVLAARKIPLWPAIYLHYLYVLYSFIVMGGVAIFEWEMLFPDRLDFLILTPLPLLPRVLFVAKARALAAFLAFFLVGSNLFSLFTVPAVSPNYLRGLLAHTLAVTLAGTFSALFFLALGGILLCVLDQPRFRLVSPLAQTLSITVLALFLVHFMCYGGTLYPMLTNSIHSARWFPPLWFLGVYEKVRLGSDAPPFAGILARYALLGTAIAAGIVAITYPLAWTRMQRMTLEGNAVQRHAGSRWFASIVHTLVPRPSERALFDFIGQTLRRNTRYQARLAIYCGVGVALILTYSTVLKVVATGTHLQLDPRGICAVPAILAFWIAAGLRTAFSLPVNLQAGWIFRVTGVRIADCAAAAKKWTLTCILSSCAIVLAVTALAGASPRLLLVQATCGLALAVLLCDALFFVQPSVPFNRPRMPGRASFPLLLTTYLGIFPLMLAEMTRLGAYLETHLLKLVWVVAAVILFRIGLNSFRRLLGRQEEEIEGYDGEYILLGLS